MNRPQKIGSFILALFLAVAIFGPMITPFDPFAIDGQRLTPPNDVNWLGTNTLGQDLFSQLVYGARTTLFIGLAVALLSTSLSALLGLSSGYSARLDLIFNSIANMLLVLPSLLLILLVVSFTGGGIWHLILTLGFLTWPGYMRLIRASVLSLREREFVKAAQLYQGGTWYVMRHHLLPFVWPLIRTKFIISFKTAVAMEASLSFLGIGDPSTPTWGKMLHDAFSYNGTFTSHSWQWTVVPPTLAILLVTIALALMAETTPSVSARWQTKTSPQKRRLTAATPSGKPAPAHEAIEVKELVVSYGERAVIQNVSFKIAAGRVTALIGQSGSGKTTLARALYGLLPAQHVSGEIYLAGKRVYPGQQQQALEPWLDVAFIFQDPRSSFNPLLTIGQQFYETMHLHRPEEKRSVAAQALRDVQLEEHVLDRYPHELSGGMLSRAFIALALINRPRILIADEPTGALDPLVKREVYDLLIKKVREYEMTLLLITHDIAAAIHLADEIILLQEGKLADDRTAKQFLHDHSIRYQQLERRLLTGGI